MLLNQNASNLHPCILMKTIKPEKAQSSKNAALYFPQREENFNSNFNKIG